MALCRTNPPAACPSACLPYDKRRGLISAPPAVDHAVTPDFQHRLDRVSALLEATLPRRPISILDAGCGGHLWLALDRQTAITGLDISAASIARHSGLDAALVGDIQSHDFAGQRFDLVVCWNVLEHVPRPADAVRNLATALSPGGVLALALPNVLSLKGLITKFTPHAVHVLAMRHIFGHPNAGAPGHAPFPTFLRLAGAPRALAGLVAECGLELLLLEVFEGPQVEHIRLRAPLCHGLYRVGDRLVAAAAGAGPDCRGSDLILMARRPAVAEAGGIAASETALPSPTLGASPLPA
jgi:SAM-dependent methyltransferase